MSWEYLFEYCYDSDRQANIRINSYITHPGKLETPDRVAYYDKHASETIKRMEEYIESLKGYRQALADRYNQLVTMPYTLHLELVRRKGYFDKRVTYTLRLYRLYEDGHKQDEQKTTYSGAERKKAFSDFEEVKKQRPGIDYKIDVEKAKWEK